MSECNHGAIEQEASIYDHSLCPLCLRARVAVLEQTLRMLHIESHDTPQAISNKCTCFRDERVEGCPVHTKQPLGRSEPLANSGIIWRMLCRQCGRNASGQPVLTGADGSARCNQCVADS